MSATEYPNLIMTSNFKSFHPITDLAPQKEYNWFTSELVRWSLPNGKRAEGILYKPENFDPKIRYPIIFYYYEKLALKLNSFIHPALSVGAINIPWFVSNGYLVFVPDIYFEIGHPGRSACNSVTSSALYFMKKPWVDGARMDCKVIVMEDWKQIISLVIPPCSLLQLLPPVPATKLVGMPESGIPWFFEKRQGRIGATLWQKPELYFENSSVLFADKVTTPVLIMQTDKDIIVPKSQGLQWYYTLHRLGKKVWFLNYKK